MCAAGASVCEESVSALLPAYPATSNLLNLLMSPIDSDVFCGGGQAPKSLTRIIYVSCGFKALETDTAVLLASGRWRLVHAEGHVFFPGSDHIESLAVFDRFAP